jgi:hypothetical protein
MYGLRYEPLFRKVAAGLMKLTRRIVGIAFLRLGSYLRLAGYNVLENI